MSGETGTQNRFTFLEKWQTEYSNIQLVIAGLNTIATFPAGLTIPIYLNYKLKTNTAKDQTGFEQYTTILLPVLGMAAVELGGKRGAIAIWGVLLILSLLSALLLVALVGPTTI